MPNPPAASGWCVLDTTDDEITPVEGRLAWDNESDAQDAADAAKDRQPSHDFGPFQCTVGFVS